MLYEHQKEIIDADPKKCGIFLGTGGGKTLTTLLLARGKTLIIMPKTQYDDGNWVREMHTLGEEAFRSGVVCMSKETFKRDHATLPTFRTVIIDEAHTVLGATPNIRWRNRQPIPKSSQIFEAVQAFIARTKPERLYLVTATPARNPMCIWAAGTLLGKSWNWEAFRRMFYTKLPMPGREVWQPKKDALSRERLAKITASLGYVGRLEDWFDVPPQVDKYIHCPLSAEQKKAIDELPLEYPDPLVLVGKTHQLEQGIAKLEAIEEMLIEYPKVLIFARYLDHIDRIHDYLKALKIPVFVLTGATKDRKKVIADAEASGRCAFIAQSQISTGYELPSFRCMVFASMDYSMVNYVQSKGRILRANKLNKNLYVHLYSGEVDRAILDCIRGHKDFSERLYAQRSGFPNKI